MDIDYTKEKDEAEGEDNSLHELIKASINFKCPKCNEDCRNIKKLRRHLKLWCKLTSRQVFECDICTEHFDRYGPLYRHRSKHNVGKEKRIVRCDTCHRDFKHWALFTAHKSFCGPPLDPAWVESILGPRLPVINKCSICDKTFKFSQSKEDHELNAHFRATPRFKCKLCETVLTNADNLTEHMLTHAPTGDKHENKSPKDDSNNTHEDESEDDDMGGNGETPAAATSSNFNMSNAPRPVPYVYDESAEPMLNIKLDQSLSRSKMSSLKKIKKKQARGKKKKKFKFACSACGKGFISYLRCNKHCQSHVGDGKHPQLETKFACTKCNRKFKLKHCLNKHMLNHKRKEEKQPNREQTSSTHIDNQIPIIQIPPPVLSSK